MFDYLPTVCRELNGNLRELYWILIVPFSLVIIVLEFFKMPGANPNVGDVLKRVLVSIIMLISFDECINTLAMVGDGVANRIQGINKLLNVLDYLQNSYEDGEVSWLKLREAVIYILNLLSYLVAYAGIFVANVLVHFVWSVLYVCSPLMILMYVSPKTEFVTFNLYKGLISVIVWKILWAILGVILFKMATSSEIGDKENFLTMIMMNLCIGISMLFIPIATKSLINDGLTSSASNLAMGPAYAIGSTISQAAKLQGRKVGQGIMDTAHKGMEKTSRPIRSRFAEIKRKNADMLKKFKENKNEKNKWK